MTALVLRQRADGRHLPRRRAAAPPTEWLRPLTRWLAGRLSRPLRGVRGRPRHGAPGASAASTCSCTTASRSSASPRPRRGRPRARRSSSCPATSRARASTCCSTPWPACPPTSGCGWPATAPRPRRLQAATAGDERIEWLGRIDDEEKARRLRGADVLCAPSLHGESFGVVLLEAMAAQTPIVASDLPGYRNVARRRQPTALLVPPGDAAALAGALRRVLDDAGRRPPRWWPRATPRAAEFSMDRLAERYLELYQAAVEPVHGSVRRPAPAPTVGPYDGTRPMIAVWIVLAVVVLLVLYVDRHLQRPGQAAEPHRERVVPDRRAAAAPLRPDPQPGGDGQGLRHARAGDVRGRHPGPGQRHQRPGRRPSRRRPRT